MEFDKTETVKEFPGLYAGSRAGEDETKNFLSVKKKKDKDKGYKAFEEDGSGASCEDVAKMPSTRLLQKLGISTSKAASSKPVKVKLFAVELKDVLNRNPSVDPKSPRVPKFLTEILDYVERQYKPGVNFYKGTSHFKSKIHQARHALNYGQELNLQEPQIAAGLVKLFLRELPTHILGPAVESKLEETKPTEKKTQKIRTLYQKEVGDVNKAVFERLVLHMDIIGIDLTPLLRVSQKALSVLRPVMSSLSIEDELKVEEARLSRLHLSVAKAVDGKDKSKAKQNQDQEKLWEAQRNVTQLKRKMKRFLSTNTAKIKEVELNLEERRECDDPKSKGGSGALEAPAGPDEKSERASDPFQSKTGVAKTDVPDEGSHPDGNKSRASSDSKEPPAGKAENEVDNEHVPVLSENKTSPVPEPKPDQILKPFAAPEAKSERTDRERDDSTKFNDKTPNPETGELAGDTADMIPDSLRQTQKEIFPREDMLDYGELPRLQQEWKNVIAEQAELLRMKDDIRRQIRDEHKQIKMIQMVRNHRSRLNAMKPAYQDPLEKMSTEKLREVLQRLVDSNAKLTRDAQTLADKVFDERMGLVHLRTERRQPLIS